MKEKTIWWGVRWWVVLLNGGVLLMQVPVWRGWAGGAPEPAESQIRSQLEGGVFVCLGFVCQHCCGTTAFHPSHP